MDIHFDKDTIYCEYHMRFMKKIDCERYCNILCTSNQKEIKDYQWNEKKYLKEIHNERS